MVSPIRSTQSNHNLAAERCAIRHTEDTSWVVGLRHMRGIEAVLFDVDGTLLDTREFIYQAYKHTLQAHGLSAISLDEIVRVMNMGKSLQESYHYFSLLDDLSELYETHRSFQTQHLSLVVPFPNTQETLK